jgi:ATP synthase F1 gamma subunit
MRPVSQIKQDIEFNKGLFSLIEVLKNIAVSQFHALEQKISSFDKLKQVIESFFRLFDFSNIHHPFISPLEGPRCVVAVTSDVGLLGGLNVRVVYAALAELQEERGFLVIVGERGQVCARDNGIPFVGFPGISEGERYLRALQLRDYVLNKILEGKCTSLKIVYLHPFSITLQRIKVVSLFPYSVAAGQSSELAGPAQIIMESRPEDMLEYLGYLWVAQRFYEIFGLSRLAEFGARFIHLEESSQKLKKREEELKLQYFRVRHELIDRSMRELFAARSLYAQ